VGGDLSARRSWFRLVSGAGAFTCAFALACSGGSGAPEQNRSRSAGPSSSDPIVVTDLVGARDAIGKRAKVVGTAQNAKLGAVIEDEDLLVYCLDRDSWPKDVTGTRVAVLGTIEWTEEFAAARSPTGEISAGTDGGIFVIRHCAPASAP
jgi:hypothetical protein